MKEELKARLRQVFLEESKTDTEHIRQLLPEVEAALPRCPVPLLEDMYKSVHKLKGACRAVGLKSAETLGFQVEYLFRHLAETSTDLSPEGYQDVAVALEAMWTVIERYARAEETGFPMEPAQRMNRLLAEAGSSQQAELPSSFPEPPASARSQKREVDPRLMAAFQAEARGLFHVLHQASRVLQSTDSQEALQEAVNTALHAAHTLKGSSRVVELLDMSGHAHELESLLKSLLEAEGFPQKDQQVSIQALIEKMEGPLFVDDALEEAEAASDLEETQVEPDRMYRVEGQRLEDLFTCFSDVLALQTSLTGLHARVRKLSEQMMTLQKQERELRQRIGPELHHPSHARVAAYVNHISRSLRNLSGDLSEQQTGQRSLEDQFSARLSALENQVNAVQVVPVEEVFAGLRGMVTTLADELKKEVSLEVRGLQQMADRHLLQNLRAPLIHLLRNALDHGIEAPKKRIQKGKPGKGRIRVSFEVKGDQLQVEVEDDGKGVDMASLRKKISEAGQLTREQMEEATDEDIRHWIFSPHLSTSEKADAVSGRGMGLSSVEEFVRKRDGSVAVRDGKSCGTCFHLELPVQRATTRITLFRRGHGLYAVPSRDVVRGFRLEQEAVEALNGSPGFRCAEGFLPVQDVGALLGVAESLESPEAGPALLLSQGGKMTVLRVDALEGEGAHVLRPLPKVLASRPLYVNATLDEKGYIVLILDVATLLGEPAQGRVTQRTSAPSGESAIIPSEQEETQSRILVVDDSFTSRTLEMGVLESYGYDVYGAVDGMDGLQKLRQEPVDLIVCDIEMPRMDGFEFLRELKSVDAWKHIPVIMISSLEDESVIRKGLSLGADSYIVKKRFEHDSLLETIQHYL